MRYTFAKRALLGRLHDEVRAAGLPITGSGGGRLVPGTELSDGVEIWLADPPVAGQADQLAAVVQAHDPAAIQAAVIQAAEVAGVERQGVQDAVATLQAYVASTGPTAAETVQAVKILSRFALFVVQRRGL